MEEEGGWGGGGGLAIQKDLHKIGEGYERCANCALIPK